MHPEFANALEELMKLHAEKSGGYGTPKDPFNNFTQLAAAKGQERWVYALDRDFEKSLRTYSLYRQRREPEIQEELLDKAGLMVCALAMYREDGLWK